MMNFTTEIKGSSFYDIRFLGDEFPEYKDGEYDIEDALFTVKWHVEIETRDWGIKEVSIGIDSVTGTFTVAPWDESQEPREITFDAAKEFQIETDINFTKWRLLSIETLMLDYSRKVVTLES